MVDKETKIFEAKKIIKENIAQIWYSKTRERKKPKIIKVKIKFRTWMKSKLDEEKKSRKKNFILLEIICTEYKSKHNQESTTTKKLVR